MSPDRTVRVSGPGRFGRPRVRADRRAVQQRRDGVLQLARRHHGRRMEPRSAGRSGSGVLPHACGMAASEGQPRCGREHGVPERPLELQDSWLTGAYDGQGGDHRYDAAARDGGPRTRYSREFHLPWLDRNQSDARTAEGPRVGERDARQDAARTSRPARGSGERCAVPGLGREFLRDRSRYRGRWRHEGLVNSSTMSRQELFDARMRKRLLLILSARIFDSSVDRGIPSRAAAPEGPKTRPPLARRATCLPRDRDREHQRWLLRRVAGFVAELARRPALAYSLVGGLTRGDTG